MVGRNDVGRNDSCPCGSGKKYKKCCERVIAFSIAEQAREQRDQRLKRELLFKLSLWFNQRFSPEMHQQWGETYKQLLQTPLDQSIPENFSLFRLWLLLDSPCYQGKRPVESWMKTIRNSPAKERVARSFCEAQFSVYEIKEIKEESMLFQSLMDGKEYEVKKGGSLVCPSIVFTRLIRLGNQYELFGPYKVFVHEMRGEILVQLEKYTHQKDHMLQVLGWSINRAKEMKKIEKLVSTPPELLEDGMKETPFFSAVEPTTVDQTLPKHITRQLEEFFNEFVEQFHEKTRSYYQNSIFLLYKYISQRYGESFNWEKLNEDALSRFLGVWYLDQGKVTPNGSKIFLNTLKYLFRWLQQEEISDVYENFKKVYVLLIRTLPATAKVKTWMMEYGVNKQIGHADESIGVYQLGVSSTGPVAYIKDHWLPVQMERFPSEWAEIRFWIKGAIQVDSKGCQFSKVEGVYPVILVDKQLQVSNSKY
ncbi:SEC-C metal-binding domain-containing protein [Hazenella coriacea]|uniref:SEC-C motif-containing protein n=1 Tax=Hazenella coriacea TaxID=1179467 RepID=A0A4R3L4U8_9BACL|nr:SEC-C metal-binding domain-containing protein [Hazenella coriacea]TCS94693.1 SEC-C motif-containing protein [Hazenella coriacea]